MRTTRSIVAAAAAVASGAVGALRRHLARRIHQPQRQLGEQQRLKLSERRSRTSKVAEGSRGSAQRIQAQPRGVSAENAGPVAA